MQSELAFSADDLALTRFTVSPMWEVVTSLRLLASASAHPVHGPWLEQVRPRVATAGLDRGTLARLLAPFGYIPDFLTPPAGEPAPDLATELAAIRATPADRVRADIDHLGPHCPALYADPETREHRPVARAEAIAAVLGRSRALLLTELEAPASTTELARRTGISPAGVSQHLTALRDAGMVSAHRAGRSVLYARTAIAESFLCTTA
ncbi:MAG: ArsR/SmtB family transcription factor [Actinoallomurus sp.]